MDASKASISKQINKCDKTVVKQRHVQFEIASISLCNLRSSDMVLNSSDSKRLN